MIKIKDAETHLRGNYKEYIGDFLRLLIALDKHPVAMIAFGEAIKIKESGSYEITDDHEGDQPTVFVSKPSGKEKLS